MPIKLKTACRYPHCPQLVNHLSGYCENHRKKVYRDYAKSRTDVSEQGFYRSMSWRKMSAAYRAAHPICENCHERPTKLVHHKQSIREGGARLDVRNFQAVCRHCQEKAHRN